MFTEQQILAAHSKVRSGADFPKYIQEVKALGLTQYEFWVTDGHTSYYGNDEVINGKGKYDLMEIASISSAATMRHNITIHQQGQTDFLTFCRQAADAGVEKWVIDTQKMMCTYYNVDGDEMVAEPIPQATY